MDLMLQEIMEIPEKAMCIMDIELEPLPLQVPYLGMGSSYFAPLAFKYMGVAIEPQIASEYHNYAAGNNIRPLAVIISQSGRSTEALWCCDHFEKYIAVSNNPENKLSNGPKVVQVINMLAGAEQYSSSKTYINTLLIFFKGFGFNAKPAVELLAKNIKTYRLQGEKMAVAVFDLLKKKHIHGIYITGSGPNIATAFEAALILSESTKLNFHGLPMAQYDHGPKETAMNSIVINILASGPSYNRTKKLSATIATAGAEVFEVEEPAIEEHFSILHNIIPFNFMAYKMAQLLKVSKTFIVGEKVTEVI